MKVFVCDRCGKVLAKAELGFANYSVHHKDGDNYPMLDLCNGCLIDLEKFMNPRDDNDKYISKNEVLKIMLNSTYNISEKTERIRGL